MAGGLQTNNGGGRLGNSRHTPSRLREGDTQSSTSRDFLLPSPETHTSIVMHIPAHLGHHQALGNNTTDPGKLCPANTILGNRFKISPLTLKCF